jgi:hypothetical protein
MEYLKSAFIIVYKGKDSNDLYTALYDGETWSGNKKISAQPGKVNARSNSNASIVFWNNRLYLVYKKENSPMLDLAYYDSTKWVGGEDILNMNGGKKLVSNSSPAIVIYKGALFTVFKDSDTNNLFYSYSNGTAWFGNSRVITYDNKIPLSDKNPGIGVFNERLYIIYKHPGSDDLYYAWFDGINWFGDNLVKTSAGEILKSTCRPCTLVWNYRLYIFYKGEANILYSAFFDGESWQGNTKIQVGSKNIESNFEPAVDLFNENPFLAYKEPHGNDLYYLWFDGTKWDGNKKIQVEKNTAQSNYAPYAGITPLINPQVKLAQDIDYSSWMSKINDDLPISEINIPGTHDSAAINSSFTTPYACQNYTITEQLNKGIRLLDVRIKVIEQNTHPAFMTCHGNIKIYRGSNEYQTLISLLDECEQFLIAHTSEVIIMSLAIDDWFLYPRNSPDVFRNLNLLLERYPVYPKVSDIQAADMPLLKQVRGKIYLYTRYNTENLYIKSPGIPLLWRNNTEGSFALNNKNRNYAVYIQDKYKDLILNDFSARVDPGLEKLVFVREAITMKKEGMVVLNFVSATVFEVFGVDINSNIINFFGEKDAVDRIKKFGWMLFDYALTDYLVNVYGWVNNVKIIVSSNFGYEGYEKPFHVIRDGHL